MAGAEQTPAGTAARSEDETLAELLAAAKRDVARTHGIDERHAPRITGATMSELHKDATALARELGVDDPTAKPRDEGGRFAGKSEMDRAIRSAAGRTT
jgi:hypothetical protein